MNETKIEMVHCSNCETMTTPNIMQVNEQEEPLCKVCVEKLTARAEAANEG